MRTCGEKPLTRFSLSRFARLPWRERRIALDQVSEIPLKRRNTLYMKAQVIQCRPLDPRSYVIGDVPGHDGKSQSSIGKINVRIAGRFFQSAQFKNFAVELGHSVGIHGAQRQVIEVTLLVPFAFLIDAPPLSRTLRKVENVPRRVMGADAREGATARTLQNFDLGIFSSEAREHGLNVFNFKAKVVETALSTGTPGIDI